MADAVLPAAAPPRLLAAAGWVGGAILSFVAMAVAARGVAPELDVVETLLWRSAIGLPVVAALLWGGGGAAGFRTGQLRGHLLRNLIHFAAQCAWFYALLVIPLAQVVTLEFTNPIWVALLAPLLLGEKLTRAKAAAVALGFLGVLVIAQPGSAALGPGHLAALAAALGFALTNIVTKRLSRAEGAMAILFWMTLLQLAFAAVIALPGGISVPSAAIWHWMALVGLTGISAHFCLTRALSIAPASLVGPMEFLRLPVIAAAGWVLYAEPVGWPLAAGALLILCGNAVNIAAGRKSRG